MTKLRLTRKPKNSCQRATTLFLEAARTARPLGSKKGWGSRRDSPAYHHQTGADYSNMEAGFETLLSRANRQMFECRSRVKTPRDLRNAQRAQRTAEAMIQRRGIQEEAHHKASAARLDREEAWWRENSVPAHGSRR